MMERVVWLNAVGMADVARVGGKNASLGEMRRELDRLGVRVPNGFASTTAAYQEFLADNDLTDEIRRELQGWARDDVEDLARRAAAIRSLIMAGALPDRFVSEIRDAYEALCAESGVEDLDVAVRSSATAEDLPEASFAGQQESYLMVKGVDDVLAAVRRCFASLFTARAINYREDMGIDHLDVSLCVVVQRMVRSDLASSGVIFTLDTDSGFDGVVYITSSWGLGENLVQGRVVPDGFMVHKDRLRAGFRPLVGRRLGSKEVTMVYDHEAHRVVNEPTADSLRTAWSIEPDDIFELAAWALVIEDHYSERAGRPTSMDIEWAKDGRTGELFIVQARPETVHSRRDTNALVTHRLIEPGEVLLEGLAIGQRISAGRMRHISDPRDMHLLEPGELLITESTDPDWEPILKRAGGLVTERGGRTSHAAIVARELGIPAIVGAGPGTRTLPDAAWATISCAEGEVGRVYDGVLEWEVTHVDLDSLPSTETQVMVNVGDPSTAYQHAQLPTSGVGLARMEFIFASQVRVHPLALTRFDDLDPATAREVRAVIGERSDPTSYLVDQLAQGIGTLGAAFWPRPVIVRFSDFKTNEYAGLVGGADFEPTEPNPMLGWRGASRYHHRDYREGFELELAAVRRVREEFGLTNVKVMIPFCRSVKEGQLVLDVMEQAGLRRGENGLEVYVMAEIPANVFDADAFAAIFDGFSIGSNDLTQLVLGVDRDSSSVADLFDEQDPAVKRACSMVIASAKQHDRKIGICGQGPSDHPEFASFLVAEGIDSISVTPDAVARTIRCVADAERELKG